MNLHEHYSENLKFCILSMLGQKDFDECFLIGFWKRPGTQIGNIFGIDFGAVCSCTLICMKKMSVFSGENVIKVPFCRNTSAFELPELLSVLFQINIIFVLLPLFFFITFYGSSLLCSVLSLLSLRYFLLFHPCLF